MPSAFLGEGEGLSVAGKKITKYQKIKEWLKWKIGN